MLIVLLFCFSSRRRHTRCALGLEFRRVLFRSSVQQTIEDAAHAITGERTGVHAAGRTDSGVHGIAMRAHLDIEKDITTFRLMEALNAKMRPLPVAVIDCKSVAGDWHARFSSRRARKSVV